MPPGKSYPESSSLSAGRAGAIASYEAAEAFLLGLVSYETKPPPARGDEAGWHLREFERFLAALGDPQNASPILHVAGTKGKGSTTRLLVALLGVAGWRRVGSFTSPHIETFRERICIGNRPISRSDFIGALEAVRGAIPRQPNEGFRTTFEVLTAMAFWHFRAAGCDAIVLETGLGGRLDCTNVAPTRVALLTTIGYDHQLVLGDTLDAIAREKAGIIKASTRRAVVGPQLPRRRRIVERVAAERAQALGVALDRFDPSSDPIHRARPEPWGFHLDLRVADADLAGVRFPVLGRHQLDNLRAALLGLRAFGPPEGACAPSAEAWRAALEGIVLPGRLEVLSREPTILADAAHCAASVGGAAKALAEHFPARPLALILGVLGDKNHRQMLDQFRPSTLRVPLLLTHAPPSPRACAAGRLAQLAREARARHGSFDEIDVCSSLTEAMQKARALQRRRPEILILSTGSTYGIAEARQAVRDLQDV